MIQSLLLGKRHRLCASAKGDRFRGGRSIQSAEHGRISSPFLRGSASIPFHYSLIASRTRWNFQQNCRRCLHSDPNRTPASSGTDADFEIL